MLNEESVKEALKAVKYPGYTRDVLSFGLVKDISASEGAVSVIMQLSTNAPDIAAQIKKDAEATLRAMPEVRMAYVEVRNGDKAPAQAGGQAQWAGKEKVPGINRVIAVASGKGGVGKSTVSVNLACALKALGKKVGLLDCDIYGPSVPLMMGSHDKPTISESEKLIPPVSHDIRLMSMGFLLDGDQPVIWRGPMIQKTVQQFIYSVEWGELDYLLVDLPPGTGDAQLSLCQTAPIDGGVIVTTPQEASLGVVRKGVSMFEKVNVPILGLVENMSYFTAPGGERVEIFGHGGGRQEAERKGIPFFGEVPIFTEIREGGDKGVPVVISAPKSAPGEAFLEVGRSFLKTVEG